MGRKDKRPESQPDRNTADEVSSKATDSSVFEEQQAEGGQTRGGEERGPEPGQYTQAGSPGYTPR